MTTVALRERDLAALRAVFERIPGIKQVRLYGSRASGGARRCSDVDLAISGPELTPTEWADLREALEEAPLIYELDVVRYDGLPNGPLRRRIEAEGVVIHERRD